MDELRGNGHDITVRVTWEAGDGERCAREAMEAVEGVLDSLNLDGEAVPAAQNFRFESVPRVLNVFLPPGATPLLSPVEKT